MQIFIAILLGYIVPMIITLITGLKEEQWHEKIYSHLYKSTDLKDLFIQYARESYHNSGLFAIPLSVVLIPIANFVAMIAILITVIVVFIIDLFHKRK